MKKAAQIARVLPVVALLAAHVHAAALDDVKLTISNTMCDGADPGDMSTVIYATNHGAQPVIVQLQYDSKPAGQVFALFDGHLAPLQDRFPKTEERQLAPGEKAAIGCTVNYRADSGGGTYNPIDVVVTVKEARYPDAAAAPGATNEEQAQQFAAFILQPGVPACASGVHPAGLLYLVNLHPFKTLNATLTYAGGKMTDFKLPPLGVKRAGCTNGDGAVASLSHVEFAVSTPAP
jgi:hypothetical protein